MRRASESTRKVTITYELDNAPAVVTLDIQTNNLAGSWASIGGKNIQAVSGDVWRKVSGKDTYTIEWQADLSWPGHKITNSNARAVVTAWALDNTPDYMVVDLTSTATKNSARYYPGVDFLPGGDQDVLYKTGALLMRKIPAKGITFMRGSVSELNRNDDWEKSYPVTMQDNYYMGVFQMTQTQWDLVQTSRTDFAPAAFKGPYRPVVNICYNEVRDAANSTTASGEGYPAAPVSGSFLGKLKDKTGYAFDLPSETQWEYACRAGNGEGHWGNGKPMCYPTKDDTAIDANLPGNYYANGGHENYTKDVGSFDPNSWGLYDMHGNAWEFCLDFFKADVTKLGGAVCTAGDNSNRIVRGGNYDTGAQGCRSARRNSYVPANRSNGMSFRVVCPVGEAE